MRSLLNVRRPLVALVVVCALGPASVCFAQTSTPAGVDVRLVTDEAEAVLAILAKKKAGQPVTEADWRRVFSSEGYVRLKARETSMKRPFEEADFRTFVLSDALAERAQALKETLARWRLADTAGAARLALAYLPKGARIRAKIYPVIKPRDNSFVFDLESDPAIFLFLDPEKSKERFENMLAHELHHIGYGTSCPPGRTSAEVAKLPGGSQLVIKLLGAFGEGFAMLAAAGGPGVHPHAYSSPEDIARWDRDAANFNDDLKRVETFFLSILENRLTAEEIQKTSASFYGVQGPWYTVGWRMSVLIERTYGRAKLIECFCDQRKLLPTYNEAAAKYNLTSRAPLALWSESLVRNVGRGGSQRGSDKATRPKASRRATRLQPVRKRASKKTRSHLSAVIGSTLVARRAGR